MSSSFIIQKGPGIASKAYNYAKKLITGGPKVSPTITSVAPKFPKNKIQAAIRDVHKTALVTKGSMKRKSQALDRDIQKVKSKLGQSMQKLVGEPVTKSGVSKGKDMKKFKTPSLNPKPINKATGGRVGKMGGGMMGRRMGYSEGKLAVTPREKRLAAQYGDKKRITRGDVITAAKKKSGERMQASVGGGAGQTRKEKILFKLNKNIKNVKEKMKGPTLTKSQINTLKRKKP